MSKGKYGQFVTRETCLAGREIFGWSSYSKFDEMDAAIRGKVLNWYEEYGSWHDQKKWIINLETRHGGRSIWGMNCYFVSTPVDLSKKVVTRAGAPAVVTKEEDGTLRAFVRTGDKLRELSFDEFGQFYPGVDSDFDLVNK